MKQNTGKCRLCDSDGQLINSHVIPDFFIKQIESPRVTGKAGDTKPHVVLASTGKSGKKQGVYHAMRGSWEQYLGVKEKLFCAACEAKLSVWEKYARELLYGNTPAPCSKLSLGVSIIDRVAPHIRVAMEAHDLRLVEGVDYQKFKLFQMSLLFRAGIADGGIFSQINLGSKHIKRLRVMLLREDPGGQFDYPCNMMGLIEGNWSFEDIMMDPVGGRDNKAGLFTYNMMLGGYMWMFEVSSHKASFRAMYALDTRGEMYVPIMSGRPVIHRALLSLPKIDPEWRAKMRLS